MAKVITIQDEKKSLKQSSDILQKSGAVKIILSKKGDIEVPYRKLTCPGGMAYRAAVSVIEACGGNSAKDVLNFENKQYFLVTGNAGGKIREHYESLATKS
jgi:hypothetical protein